MNNQDQLPEGNPPVQQMISESELIIAFVAAVGVDLEPVEDAAKHKLSSMGYEVISIRLTRDVIPQICGVRSSGYPCEYDRYWEMMNAGDKARELHGSDVLALGVAAQIFTHRNKRGAEKKVAYFVRSLKHPEEVIRLRSIYPRGFNLFAVQASGESRRHYLMHKNDMSKSDANKLMLRDRKDGTYGQRHVDTYPLADFFICVQDESNGASGWGKSIIETNVNRFIEILFGHPNRTPTFGEHAMFLAFSSSLRSADLSRQVGAVIARNREVLGAGANDCPSPHGGLYWPIMNAQTFRIEDAAGGRDYLAGGDSNRKELLGMRRNIYRRVITEFDNVIQSGPWRKNLGYNSQLEFAGVERELKAELWKRLDDILAKSPIADLTEFGRVVHAEMEALLSCARKGISTVGATLYSTTFPCHNCAKHIVAAGVQKVVFIEPYLKSKATDLHPDAVEISYPDPTKPISKFKPEKVLFQPFVGVGPRRFFDLFSMRLSAGYEILRKDDLTGDAKGWSEKTAAPRLDMSPNSYRQREKDAAEIFFTLLGGSNCDYSI